MILVLHNRYRTTGGEERAVDDLLWLIRENLGEDAELLARDSARVGHVGAAAGLLGGGLRPDEVGRAVRRTGARIVHAHNLHPTLGWRALAAAREAGARVVLHLHQYRLVCAVGVCFTHGEECTRCHGRNTLPGVLRNCRGSLVEAVTYGAALALWQPRLAGLVDAFVVPSAFTQERLRELGAPVLGPYVLPHVIRRFARESAAAEGRHALVVARLAPEKGVDVAIEACRLAGIPLVVAGDGPERARLTAMAGPDVTFAGRVDDHELERLRRQAVIALVPSRSGETFGLAAAEAMATGLPVLASRVGALPELVPGEWLVPAGDPGALAAAIGRLRNGVGQAGALAIEQARRMTGPGVVSEQLARIYAAVAG
ncbi:MAG: glycosyltransferase family 4 protein [Solirubrobacteraceae bacterium]